MAFRTKLDFSSNRQVKQHEKTITVLSGGTSFGLTYSAMTSGPDSTSSAITETIAVFTGSTSTFSGNNTTTNFTWFDSRMSLADSVFSAITSATTATTQYTNILLTPNDTTTIDGNLVNLTYSGVSFDITPSNVVDLGGGNYSGNAITYVLDILSASTLDFKGRTIWNDVSGITRTEKLIITDNPQVGYVWTCLDSEGMGGWLYNGSGTTLWVEDGTGNTAMKDVHGNGSITGTSDYSIISGGYSNKIYDSLNSVIVGGLENNIFSHNYSTIINGTGNTIHFDVADISRPSTFEFIDNSRDSFISASTLAKISSSDSVTISNTILSSIINSVSSIPDSDPNLTSCAIIGTDNDGDNGVNSIINTVDGLIKYKALNNTMINSNLSKVLGTITGSTSSFNLIGNSTSAEMNDSNNTDLSNNYNTVLGSYNVVLTAPNISSSVLGSSSVLLDATNTSSVYSSKSSQMTSGVTSSIIGGSGHTLFNNIGSIILGGSNNGMGDINRSVILGGDNLVGTAHDTTYTPNLTVDYQDGSYASTISLNTSTPQYVMDLWGSSETRFYYQNSANGNVVVSGSAGLPRLSASVNSSGGGGGCGIGIRGWDDVIYTAYGKQGDSHLYSSKQSNGLNIISSDGTGTEDYIRFWTGGDAAIPSNLAMHIHGTGGTKGYIGVNNTAPTERLDVNGSARFRSIGSSASSGALHYTSDGTLTTNTSDQRLKTNVTTLVGALDKVNQLRGVTYNWKENPTGDTRIGFIAQEVSNVIPELTFVNPNSEQQYMGVHYDNVTALLVEAVKELSSGVTTSNNTHLETQTILAEDNNIELNYNGTPETAVGGGIRVLHALGEDNAAELITDADGNFVTNNGFKPNALTIPLYTPTSSNDAIGYEGNITRDDNYLYIKTSTGWKRTNLESF